MTFSSQIDYTADGFPGQRMRVVPRPRVAHALGRPGTSQLLVTDCGYFPHAARHRKIRRHGLRVAIVIVCVSGAGICEIDGQTHPVRGGELVLIPPGTPHDYRADAADPWTIWWMHLAGTDVDNLLAATRTDRAHPVIGVADVHRVASLVEEAIGRLEQDEADSTLLAASGAAWHLMALLAADQTPLGSRVDRVAQAQNYLRSHIGVRTSLGELSAVVGLSPSHLSALFRAKTGSGIIEYQTRLRMGVARELLDTSDRTIEQTAQAVGYDDSFYFSRQFRLIHGISPSEYRNRVKNEPGPPEA